MRLLWTFLLKPFTRPTPDPQSWPQNMPSGTRGGAHACIMNPSDVPPILVTPVMSLINDKNGGNNFTLPHTGLRKAMREDGWDI